MPDDELAREIGNRYGYLLAVSGHAVQHEVDAVKHASPGAIDAIFYRTKRTALYALERLDEAGSEHNDAGAAVWRLDSSNVITMDVGGCVYRLGIPAREDELTTAEKRAALPILLALEHMAAEEV